MDGKGSTYTRQSKYNHAEQYPVDAGCHRCHCQCGSTPQAVGAKWWRESVKPPWAPGPVTAPWPHFALLRNRGPVQTTEGPGWPGGADGPMGQRGGNGATGKVCGVRTSQAEARAWLGTEGARPGPGVGPAGLTRLCTSCAQHAGLAASKLVKGQILEAQSLSSAQSQEMQHADAGAWTGQPWVMLWKMGKPGNTRRDQAPS